MQVSSLLLVPDRSTCALSLHSFSDQALMEALIDGLKSQSKTRFIHPDGTYRDACKWKGVHCSGCRKVKRIQWDTKSKVAKALIGTLAFENLPPSVREVHISRHCHFDGSHIYGSIDTSGLPQNLTFFALFGVNISGTLDLCRLPADLQHFSVTYGSISGRCCLTALPLRMTVLRVTKSFLSGSISLDYLPWTLKALDLSKNELGGTLNLKELPEAMLTLDLSANHFTGDIDLGCLSHRIQDILLYKNSLSGVLRMPHPPNSLELLNVKENRLTGPAVLSDIALRIVHADPSVMNGAIDPSGKPYSAEEIQKCVKFRSGEIFR